MKENTKLILMGLGAGVVANMVLAPPVAGMTSGYPMVAAGAEGIGALAAGYMAYKKKSKVAAVAAGAFAGLLVASFQGGLISQASAAPLPPKPAPTPKPLSSAASSGAALPQAVNVAGVPGVSLPGFSTMSGQIPAGSAVPKPNRPPNAAETQAYADWLAQEAQNRQIAMAQQAAALQQGGLPTVADQSGAATRIFPQQRQSSFGAGGSVRRGIGY